MILRHHYTSFVNMLTNDNHPGVQRPVSFCSLSRELSEGKKILDMMELSIHKKISLEVLTGKRLRQPPKTGDI